MVVGFTEYHAGWRTWNWTIRIGNAIYICPYGYSKSQKLAISNMKKWANKLNLTIDHIDTVDEREIT